MMQRLITPGLLAERPIQILEVCLDSWDAESRREVVVVMLIWCAVSETIHFTAQKLEPKCLKFGLNRTDL